MPLFGLVLLTGCGPEPTRQEQAVEIAYKHARERFAESNPDYWLPPEKIEDQGDSWVIKFGSRPDSTGGGPWVEVRKSDLEVLGSVAFQ